MKLTITKLAPIALLALSVYTKDSRFLANDAAVERIGAKPETEVVEAEVDYDMWYDVNEAKAIAASFWAEEEEDNTEGAAQEEGDNAEEDFVPRTEGTAEEEETVEEEVNYDTWIDIDAAKAIVDSFYEEQAEAEAAAEEKTEGAADVKPKRNLKEEAEEVNYDTWIDLDAAKKIVEDFYKDEAADNSKRVLKEEAEEVNYDTWIDLDAAKAIVADFYKNEEAKN